MAEKRRLHSFAAPGRLRSKRGLALACTVLAFLAISASAASQATTLPEYFVETYINFVSRPTSMVFVSDNELLVLEKSDGRVQHYLDGVFQGNALTVNVSFLEERGILGICLHPDFANNGFVYIYYSLAETQGGTWLDNRVERFVWDGSTLTFESVIVVFPFDPDQVNGPGHNSGIILIGQDEKLYVITGDMRRGSMVTGETRIEQNTGTTDPSGVGGIARLNLDGSIPADNPFFGESDPRLQQLFTYGNRNSFGMIVDPITGLLWYTENGVHIYDELNIAEAGFNSGWVKIFGPDSRDAYSAHSGGVPWDAADLTYLPGAFYRDPIFNWLQPIGVTSIAFLTGIKFGPSLRNRVLIGDFNFGQLYLFEPNTNRDGVVPRTGTEDLVADTDDERNQYVVGTGWGITTSLVIGPDGYLYVASHNQHKVYRIRPILDPFVPASFQIFRGLLLSGNLQSLAFSDDDRLVVRPGIVINSSVPPVQVIVEATAPVSATTELRFRLEASTDIAGIRQWIELFNFTTGMYEEVDVRMATTSDSVIDLTFLAGASRFIESGTRKMRARLKWKAAGPIVSYPWQARIDQIVWTVRV